MATTAFNVSKVELNSQSQTSGTAESTLSYGSPLTRTITLYSPSDLSGQAVNAIFNLKSVPNAPIADVGSDFRSPHAGDMLRAYIVRTCNVLIDTADNGVSFDIGNNATSANTSDTIFDAVTPALIDTGALVVDTTYTTAGGQLPFSNNGIQVAGTAAGLAIGDYITCQVLAGPITTVGAAFAVQIDLIGSA